MSAIPTANHLYLDLSDRLTNLIHIGTLRPGQRMPSVRKLSRLHDVSISTVLQAYKTLEDRGLVHVRPQSGHYVRLQFRELPPEPAMPAPATSAAPVNVGDLVMQLIHAARQPDIVPLGAAIPSHEILPTMQVMRVTNRVSRLYARQAQGYELPPGHALLRTQIAHRLVDSGCALAPDEIIITSGASEALSLCLQAVTKPGDVIGVETPTFYGLLQVLESLHLKALELPVCSGTGLCLTATANALRKHKLAAVVVTPNFHNPLGCLWADDKKRDLVAMLAKRGVPLIEDDIYGDLAHDMSRPKVCKAFDKEGLVMTCSSFSKTLAPGYRIGWAAPGKWRDKVELLKLAHSVASPSLPQLAIAHLLASGGYDRMLRRLRKSYAELVQLTTAKISDVFPKGTCVSRPTGGFVLWVEMPTGIDAMKLHTAALQRGISVAPGPLFSATGRYPNCLRINCGHPWTDRIAQALTTLGSLAHEQLATSTRRVPGIRKRVAS